MPTGLHLMSRGRHRAGSPRSSFRLILLVLAALVAAVPSTLMTARPAQAVAGSDGGEAIWYALNQLGLPYSYGTSGPHSFDCSGLVYASYRYAGVSIPRVSRDQWNAGPHLPLSQVQPGDLIFHASNTSDPSTIYHVGLYAGGGYGIFAPHTGTVVQIESIFYSGLMPYVVRPGYRTAGMLDVNQGEMGSSTKAFQFRLRANGYPLTIDGAYGSSTRTALDSWKTRLGYAADGIGGGRSWAALIARGPRTSVLGTTSRTTARSAESTGQPFGRPAHRIPAVPLAS